MPYRIFLQCYASGEAIASTAPVEMDLRRLLRLVEDKLRGPDDYVGLVDANEGVLQIQRLDEDLYQVELPDFERRCGLCRPFTRAGLGEWLEDLPGDFSRLDLEAFTEVPW